MKRFTFILLSAAALCAGIVISQTGSGVAVAAKPSKPNVVVVMTDDQSTKTWGKNVMPKTFKLLGPENGGTRFKRGMAVPPLCCPARAGFLTAQYPHNHGVWQNNYELLEDKEDVLPVWLQKAGYHTALIGKHLNKYEEYAAGSKRSTPLPPGAEMPSPPGFDVVYQQLDNRFRNYRVNDNGVVRKHGSTGSEFLTNVMNRKAVSFLNQHFKQSSDQPFFLYLSHFAPHADRNKHKDCGIKGAPDVLPRDWQKWRNKPAKIGPNFNEADISDKPKVEKLPKLTKSKQESIKKRFLCTRASMAPVDRGVAKVVNKLEDQGVLDDTIIFFISDNGYFFGEHRIFQGKNRPYREAIEVPFMARVPAKYLGQQPLGSVNQPATNIDVAPTILDLANINVPHRTADGLSLAPALRGERLQRDVLLFEQRSGCQKYSTILDIDTDVLYSVWFDKNRWATSEKDCRVLGKEYYDLSKDPHQLENQLAGVGKLPDRLQGNGGGKKNKAKNKIKKLKRKLKQCTKKGSAKTKKRCKKRLRKKIRQVKRQQRAKNPADLLPRKAKARAKRRVVLDRTAKLEQLRKSLRECNGADCRLSELAARR